MILDDVTAQVESWTWELAGWLDRVAPVFARPEPRELLRQMTVGLLSPLRKKNAWALAEQAGHTHPGRIQTFLCRGAWDAAALEARVRDLVVESLGDTEDGVLIIDDTQIIKKGTKSVGVAPQHCGATNQIENCQCIVMLAYARLGDRGGGHAFIGHRLYLPERWTKDPDRCREAGIPTGVVFAGLAPPGGRAVHRGRGSARALWVDRRRRRLRAVPARSGAAHAAVEAVRDGRPLEPAAGPRPRGRPGQGRSGRRGPGR